MILGFKAMFLCIGGSEFILCWIIGFVLHLPTFISNLLLMCLCDELVELG